jgi:hypothetical protein
MGNLIIKHNKIYNTDNLHIKIGEFVLTADNLMDGANVILNNYCEHIQNQSWHINEEGFMYIHSDKKYFLCYDNKKYFVSNEIDKANVKYYRGNIIINKKH